MILQMFQEFYILYYLLMIQVFSFCIMTPMSLTNIIQTELQKLSLWFKANKLSLNIDKTKFMVFTPRQKRDKLNITLVIDGKQIKQAKDNIF